MQQDASLIVIVDDVEYEIKDIYDMKRLRDTGFMWNVWMDEYVQRDIDLGVRNYCLIEIASYFLYYLVSKD